MSELTVYRDATPDAPELRTTDPSRIAVALREIGVAFDRWQSPVAVGPDDDEAAILAAYRPHLDRLMGPGGAGSADVLRLRGAGEAYPAMRAKFLSEHTHTEDEIRFFVDGGGHFVMHARGRVYDAHCTAGDLIAVPAELPHWFDAGTAPHFTALRVFTDISGWVPHYTGDDISARFPVG